MSASATDSPPLLSIPPETLDAILELLDPVDVAAFSAVCRATRDFCRENAHLWTTLFLQHFDPPQPSPDHTLFEYQAVLKARIRARGLINLAHTDGQLPRVVAAFPPTLATFIAIAQTAPGPNGRNLAFLATLFPYTSTAFTAEWLSMYLDPKRAEVAPVVRQHAAHFELLHGPTRMYEGFRRLQALRRVYDLQNYSKDTSFGPFLKDGSGRVDWVLLESIRRVSDYQLVIHVEREGWGTNPTTDAGLEESIGRDKGRGWADSVRRDVSRGTRDWAGVEADWIGTYGFLDHEVFEALNTSSERKTGTLHLSDFREAIGDLMALKLKLDPPREPVASAEEGPFPRLTFTGTLGPRYSVPNSPAPILGVTGSVSRGPEQAVTWHYKIIYAGAVQWVLEGVQVGSEGSRAGVRGIWTHATRLAMGMNVAEGPCGPFAWWIAA
ncbi:hypothetical protein RQP46_007670 [Phenoliferia psychrophenolica]